MDNLGKIFNAVNETKAYLESLVGNGVVEYNTYDTNYGWTGSVDPESTNVVETIDVIVNEGVDCKSLANDILSKFTDLEIYVRIVIPKDNVSNYELEDKSACIIQIDLEFTHSLKMKNNLSIFELDVNEVNEIKKRIETLKLKLNNKIGLNSILGYKHTYERDIEDDCTFEFVNFITNDRQLINYISNEVKEIFDGLNIKTLITIPDLPTIIDDNMGCKFNELIGIKAFNCCIGIDHSFYKTIEPTFRIDNKKIIITSDICQKFNDYYIFNHYEDNVFDYDLDIYVIEHLEFKKMPKDVLNDFLKEIEYIKENGYNVDLNIPDEDNENIYLKVEKGAIN